MHHHTSEWLIREKKKKKIEEGYWILWCAASRWRIELENKKKKKIFSLAESEGTRGFHCVFQVSTITSRLMTLDTPYYTLCYVLFLFLFQFWHLIFTIAAMWIHRDTIKMSMLSYLCWNFFLFKVITFNYIS